MSAISADEGGPSKPVPVVVPVEYFHGTEKNLPYNILRRYEAFDFGYALTVHKCVHPDTLVETGEGLLPIRTISHAGVTATPFDGPQLYGNKITRAQDRSVRIDCEQGYFVIVTFDHRVEICTSEGSRLIEAQDVQVGDWMRVRLGSMIDPENLCQLPKAPVGDMRSTIFPVPSHCDEAVAEFLGLMVADGTVYKKGFRLLKRHADVADRFGSLCQHLFSTPGNAVAWNGATGYEVNSTQLAAWLRQIGGLEPKNKMIPDCILRSPRRVQAAFLRGLFEDGGVNIKNNIIDHIEWSTSVKRLSEIVQTLLLRFSIASSRNSYGFRNYWRISIYGDSIERFKHEIGFVSIKKNELLHMKHPSSRRQQLLQKENIPWLRELLQWHYVRVTSITASLEESMCIEVPIGHRFMQNGFPHCNSQGSQWDHVLLFDESHVFRENARRHLYTGLTRAAKKITIVL